jgi:hypothetical protein
MEIIISANSKAAAVKAIQKLKEIEGITIKSPVESLSFPKRNAPKEKTGKDYPAHQTNRKRPEGCEGRQSR